MAQPPARRILVLFAHPAFHRSRVQRQLAAAVRALDGVTFHDLYEAYPDFDVDVPSEQALLAAHDLYVLQHPLYWYGTPPLVKQWIDLVLEHGWAYGHGGTALRGKQLLCALSAGGSAESYRPDGANRFSLRALLAPIEQTATFCGVEFLPPFVVQGTHAIDGPALVRAAGAYRHLVESLRDGRIAAAALHARAALAAGLDPTAAA
jgi:glutathione-regulated potassium-efflux system ancillary protein KefG